MTLTILVALSFAWLLYGSWREYKDKNMILAYISGLALAAVWALYAEGWRI